MNDIKKILLVTDGLFHPPWLGRIRLHRLLRQIDGFLFEHTRSLEHISADLPSFSALVLNYHHKKISPAALERLDAFVKNGGGLLAIHAATASFKETLHYFDILGGRFIGHGAVEKFAVQRSQSDIFSGIENFVVKDELYIHELKPEIEVHFTARLEGRDIPAVWTYLYGRGRVCYACPGHTSATMGNPAYQEVLRRGLQWVCGVPLAAEIWRRLMDKLQLAVIGCGDIAGFTALLSRLVPQITLAACCDVNAERAQQFARRLRIPLMFTDYTELLTNAAVDAVYLAVPHHLHAEMVRAFIGIKKPVFVEKPLTRTLAEGVELIEVIRQSGVKVGVNYQYRYDRGCYSLARAIQAGELGRIHSICINIPWHRSQAYFDNAAWHKTLAQAGGGTLITQGSHFLDVALWALGEQPLSTMGYTATPGFAEEVETLAHGIVETTSGALISITSSMAAASEQAVSITAYGERGTGLYRNLPLPSAKFVGVKVRKQRPPGWGVHALQRSLSGFANWVLADKPFLIPAESTLPVLAAVDGIYRSAKTGQRLMIG